MQRHMRGIDVSTPETRKPTSESGFSVMELMIVVALFAVVLGAVVEVTNSSHSAYADVVARSNTVESARRVMERIVSEVRFVEASRDDIREIGFGTDIGRPGDFLFMTSASLISGDPARAVGQVFGGAGNTSIDFTLQALEEQGVIRTLAKPNLVSQSGQPASFLAGGEFPVPVAADQDTITIEFKKFGVSLEFTPTIAREDRIVLQVAPEVSNLDPRNSVRLANVEIPALSVREIQTQVELGNGQSFAIAGLIQNDYQATELETPLLGDIPILGNLFRSSRFKKNETELVVIITPHLVLPPESNDALTDPIMLSEEPSQVDRYALSRIEGSPQPELGRSVDGNIQSQSTAPGLGGR